MASIFLPDLNKSKDSMRFNVYLQCQTFIGELIYLNFFYDLINYY